jgi:hypothetical protein
MSSPYGRCFLCKVFPPFVFESSSLLGKKINSFKSFLQMKGPFHIQKVLPPIEECFLHIHALHWKALLSLEGLTPYTMDIAHG